MNIDGFGSLLDSLSVNSMGNFSNSLKSNEPCNSIYIKPNHIKRIKLDNERPYIYLRNNKIPYESTVSDLIENGYEIYGNLNKWSSRKISRLYKTRKRVMR